jgi:YbbR domain-containing protein
MRIRKISRKAVLAGLKNFFTKNIALKIIALVFALLLWGYVLTDQKPVRTKIVRK